MKLAAIFFVYLLAFSSCAGSAAQNGNLKNSDGQAAGGKAENPPVNSNADSIAVNASQSGSTDSAAESPPESVKSAENRPRFFYASAGKIFRRRIL